MKMIASLGQIEKNQEMPEFNAKIFVDLLNDNKNGQIASFKLFQFTENTICITIIFLLYFWFP